MKASLRRFPVPGDHILNDLPKVRFTTDYELWTQLIIVGKDLIIISENRDLIWISRFSTKAPPPCFLNHFVQDVSNRLNLGHFSFIGIKASAF